MKVDIKLVITIGMILLSLAVAWGIMKNQVEKNEAAVGKAAGDIVDIKIIDMRQTTLLDSLEKRF